MNTLIRSIVNHSITTIAINHRISSFLVAFGGGIKIDCHCGMWFASAASHAEHVAEEIAKHLGELG